MTICKLDLDDGGEPILLDVKRSDADRIVEAMFKDRQLGLDLVSCESRFDLAEHLTRQFKFSMKIAGPGLCTKRLLDHIRKETLEIEADPTDMGEWIDIVILALDGATRLAASPDQVIDALVARQTRNEGRVWTDWRTADPDKAIEHVRSHDQISG